MIKAGKIPENYLSSIRAAHHDIELNIVAIELGAEHGCIAVLDTDRLRVIGNFTRNPGLAFLVMMIQAGIGAEAILVGTQPETTLFVSGFSNPVRGILQTNEEPHVNYFLNIFP